MCQFGLGQWRQTVGIDGEMMLQFLGRSGRFDDVFNPISDG